MTSRSMRCALTVFATLGLLAVGSVQAGDSGFQANFGGSFFATSPPCPLKDFPALELLTPVPDIIDPFEDDIIPVFCQIQVERNGNPVRNAKFNFTSELVVLDNNTGMFETFPLDSGKLKTNSTGIDDFDFEIPADLFADGFESGDVSAWSYTRVESTKKKKADTAQVSCDAVSGISN